MCVALYYRLSLVVTKPSCAVVNHIYKLAHDYSNLANRTRPIVTDLMQACEDSGLSTNDLHRIDMASRKRKRGTPFL